MGIKLWRSQNQFNKKSKSDRSIKKNVHQQNNRFDDSDEEHKLNESSTTHTNNDSSASGKLAQSRRDIIKMLCMYFLLFETKTILVY